MKQDDWKPLPVMLIRFIEDHRSPLRRQLGKRAAGRQFPAGEDQQVAADGLHLAEDVAGQEDGVAPAQFPHQPPDLDHLRRVKPGGGFVQDDELRAAQQGLRDAHPLAVSLGEAADQPGHHLRHAGAAGRRLRLRRTLGPPDPFQGGGKAEILLHRHLRVEGRGLGQVADAGPGRPGLLGQRVAADCHRPVGGRKVAGEDVPASALARAVRPEQAVDLPVPDGEGQVLDRRAGAVAPGQMGYFDQKADTPFHRAMIPQCRAQMCSK